MLLRRIEQALENIIDGGLARLGGVSVHPLEIARRLQARMEESRLIGTGAPWVANRYTARLHDEDLQALGGVVEDVAEQLARHLDEYAREQGWACGGGVRVRIEGGGTRRGQVDVEHSFDETPPPARLVVLSGEPQGAVYEIGERAVIGREPGCEVTLSDPAVSRRHADIEWTYAGHLLRDLGSRNGTCVNDQPVVETILSEGDVVRVGTTQLRIDIG